MISDLTNTILSETIKDGKQVRKLGREYIIITPKLNDYISVETLKVKILSGELEIWKSMTAGTSQITYQDNNAGAMTGEMQKEQQGKIC